MQNRNSDGLRRTNAVSRGEKSGGPLLLLRVLPSHRRRHPGREFDDAELPNYTGMQYRDRRQDVVDEMEGK